MLLNINESKEIMKAIELGISKNARKEDYEDILRQLKGMKLDGNSFLNQVHSILKRYFTTKRTISIMLDISLAVRNLLDIDISPKVLEVSQGEQLAFKVKITNNSGLASKFRIITEQANKNTPAIYDPKKNLVDFRREIELLIDSIVGVESFMFWTSSLSPFTFVSSDFLASDCMFCFSTRASSSFSNPFSKTSLASIFSFRCS